MRITFFLLSLRAVFAPTGARTDTQGNVQPVNGLPNPDRTIENCFKLAEEVVGLRSAVDIDIDGRFIWVAERCAAYGSDFSNHAPAQPSVTVA